MSKEFTIRPGTMVGEYRVERVIGQGGVGVIYEAIHPLIRKRVAIKVLSAQFASDPVAVSRFVLEARSVNEIGHHNIVDIFAMGQLPDGRTYLVMEYLDGLDLDDVLAGVGRMRPAHVVPLFAQMCDALGDTHAKGFIHRDLKPSNVVVLRRGPHPRIKLLDFGLAKLRGGDGEEVTVAGTVLGTPQYMAPEQCRGDKVDPRTDIYALGVMLFELITGVRPFDGPAAMPVLELQLNKPPPPPSSLEPEAEPLDRVVLTALNKAPERRYPSVAALLAALRSALGPGKRWQRFDRPGPPLPTAAAQDIVPDIPEPVLEVVVPEAALLPDTDQDGLDNDPTPLANRPIIPAAMSPASSLAEDPTVVDELVVLPVDTEHDTVKHPVVVDERYELASGETQEMAELLILPEDTQPAGPFEAATVDAKLVAPLSADPDATHELELVDEEATTDASLPDARPSDPAAVVGWPAGEQEASRTREAAAETGANDHTVWPSAGSCADDGDVIGPVLVEVSTEEIRMENTGVFANPDADADA